MIKNIMESGVLSDDVMRKKLLVDGEGIGDDRRLTLLMKTFLKWCNSTSESDSEMIQIHERMVLMLAQCENAMIKSHHVQKTHQTEIENYDSLHNSIENSLTKANQKITKYKNELQTARRIRKNKQEYDALAKVILSEPDREQTLKKLHDIDQELKDLEATKKKLDSSIEERRKQSHVLINAINQLLYFVEEDEANIAKEASEPDQMEVDS